jgi:hypothetical protein
VEVAIVKTDVSFEGLSTAGTLYAGSIGKYRRGKSSALRSSDIGLDDFRNAASFAARMAATRAV